MRAADIYPCGESGGRHKGGVAGGWLL